MLTDSIQAVDRAIRRYPWLDFDVLECSPRKVRIAGSIDPSSAPDLIVEFEDIAAVSLPMEWRTDTTKVVFAELDNLLASELNLAFHVEVGYTAFHFVADDRPGPCVVLAKSVSV